MVKGIRGFTGKIDSAPSSQVADEYPIQTAAIQECTVSDVLHGAGDGHSFEIATLKECKTAYGGHWSYDNVRDLAAENIVQRHSAGVRTRSDAVAINGHRGQAFATRERIIIDG